MAQSPYIILFNGPKDSGEWANAVIYPQCLYTNTGRQIVIEGEICQEWVASWESGESFIYTPINGWGPWFDYEQFCQNIAFEGNDVYNRYYLYVADKDDYVSSDDWVCARVLLNDSYEEVRQLSNWDISMGTHSGLLYHKEDLLNDTSLVFRIKDGYNRMFVDDFNQFIIAGIDDEQWYTPGFSEKPSLIFAPTSQYDNGEMHRYIGGTIGDDGPEEGEAYYEYQVALDYITVFGQTTTFNVGDTFVFDGNVIVRYSDGTERDVTSSATHTTPSMSSAGSKRVDVYYSIGGYSIRTSYYITVQELVLDSITVNGQTTTFNVGDTFVFDGIVTAHYTDGTSRNVTSSATHTTPSMSSAGTRQVTVTYSEGGLTKTTAYNITVSIITVSPIINIDGIATATRYGQFWLKNNTVNANNYCPNYYQFRNYSIGARISDTPHFTYTDNMLVREDDVVFDDYGSYIHDGLCLMLDGVNNGSSGNYDIEWQDLTGNRTFVANGNAHRNVNGCGWNFDGSNSWIDNQVSPYYINGVDNSTQMTIEVVTNIYGWGSDSWAFLFGTHTNNNNDARAFCLTPSTESGNNVIFLANRQFTTAYKFPLTFNKLQTITIVTDGTTQYGYFNLESVTEISRNGSYSSNNQSVSIGRRNYNGNIGAYLRGDIYAIRVYNRPLSRSEVINNQTIDIARYNIPMN